MASACTGLGEMEAQASRAKGRFSLADMVLMGGAREVLVTPGSTFGYVAQGLAGRRAITYGGTHTSRELVGPQQLNARASRRVSQISTSQARTPFRGLQSGAAQCTRTWL